MLAIICGVVVLFLIICGLFAYHAFYPEGIPDHLKGSEDEDKPKSENDNNPEAAAAADGDEKKEWKKMYLS